ncbi:MAG: hypothetical protein OEW75_05000 [Cyclobacteriaceae bacterium]|nr:hypothetical protein [Cyclobacteriaceae bacterium]
MHEKQMRYIPSPTPLKFSVVYTATSNSSGRMQYHRIEPGKAKTRISRSEFITAFNSQHIIAIRPIPQKENIDTVLQLEIYL